MSTKQMQRARVNGAELEFEVTGAGEPVLLIHGAFIAEPFVLAGSNHALEEKDPRGIADAMAPFLARHPMPVLA